MKIKNKRIYSTDREYISRLKDEYRMLGFDTDEGRGGMLTIFALRRKKVKKKKEEKEKEPRNKRAEKHARD